MPSRFTVFVCGTYLDLSAERGAVLDAIQRLQLRHDSMEFFGARPERAIDTCLAEVRKSDIVVVIVGEKYGSAVPGLDISYSEAEYNEARRVGLPCLVYLLENGTSLGSAVRDRHEKLGSWRAELKRNHTTYSFKNPADLALQVAADLGREIHKREKPSEEQEQTPRVAPHTVTDGPATERVRVRPRFCDRYGDESRQLLYGLAIDSHANVIITGSFWGEINFGAGSLRSRGDRNIFVAKFSSAGRLLWSRAFGDEVEKVAVGVEVDSKGSIFLVGAFTGALNFGGTTLHSTGRYSIAVAKFDRDGHHIWSRSFGDHGYHVPECFAVSPSGQVVVAGRFTGSIDFDGTLVKCQSSQTDIFLAALSSEGSVLWAKGFGGGYEQQTRSIAADREGSIVVAGVFKGSIVFDDHTLVESHPGDYCGFLTKLDRDGRTQWCKRFGEPFVEQGSAVAFDQGDGDIVAAGFIRNKLPEQLTKSAESICLFARYDTSGILRWSKTFGACAFPDTLSVVPNGRILLTGHFQLTVDFGLGRLVSAGGNDIFAALFASDGTTLWSERFGDERQQFLVRGVHDAGGLIALAGSFHGTINFGTGLLTAAGYDGAAEGAEDVFLALFDTEIVRSTPVSPAPVPGDSAPLTDHAIHRIGRIVGEGLVGLLVALVLGALTVFGVINALLGHVLLFLAWIVGTILIVTEVMPTRTIKRKLAAALILLLFFAAADWAIQRLRTIQNLPSEQAPQPAGRNQHSSRNVPSGEARSPIPIISGGPPANSESHGTMDKIEAGLQHHETSENLGAKLSHANPKKNNRPTNPCTLPGGKYYEEPRDLPGGADLRRPVFEMEGTYGTDYKVLETAWAWGNDQYLLLFNISLTSRGDESIVKNWQLCLLIDEGPQFFQVGAIPNDGVTLTTGEKIHNDDTLTEKAIRTPIKHGVREAGWVAFSIPKELAKRFIDDKIQVNGSIRFEDYLAHTYSWNIQGTAEAPKGKVYVPGTN